MTDTLTAAAYRAPTCGPLQPDTLTPEWRYYLGEYEKSFYDVVTTQNIVHRECWPNAGDFHCTTCKAVLPEPEVYVFRLAESEKEQ